MNISDKFRRYIFGACGTIHVEWTTGISITRIITSVFLGSKKHFVLAVQIPIKDRKFMRKYGRLCPGYTHSHLILTAQWSWGLLGMVQL